MCNGSKSRRRWLATLLAALVTGITQAASADDEITIQISWKIILDSGGNPPTGQWTQTATWDEAIVLGNDGHERFGRGFRYTHQFGGYVAGAGQFFDLDEGEGCALETAARGNPAQFHWRNDAMNVYVVNRSGGTAASPLCHGFAHSPDGDCNGTYNPNMVVMCSNALAGVGMCHEFGHFFGLRHTWANDLVADTPIDANPNQCHADVPGTTHNERCDLGSDRECCCQTQIDLTLQVASADGWSTATTAMMIDNLMSYHCRINNYYTLSEGQLDRYTDFARRYGSALCTGVTFFVNNTIVSFPPYTGYSDDPYRGIIEAVAASDILGGDIIMIRSGNYPGTYSISRPVTLRACRGIVRIGI